MPQPLPPDPHEQQLVQEVERLAFRAFLADAVRRRARLTPVLLVVLALAFLAQETVGLWLGPDAVGELTLALANVPERVLRGEGWRLLTGAFLHADLWHLLPNLLGLFVLGRQIEATYGSARFFLIYVGALLAGALATLSAGVPMSVGASAAIYGMLGALVALGVRLWPRLTPGLRRAMLLLPAGLLLLLLGLGLASAGATDPYAHLGGALGGLGLGLVLRPQLRAFDPRAGRGFWSAAWLRGVAWGALGLCLLALGLGALHVGRPLELTPVAPAQMTWDGRTLPVPAGTRGLWRDGACRGQLVDGDWALRTGRQPCFGLPLGAALLLVRLDSPLVDAGDRALLPEARRLGRFLHRQPGVMLHPLGDDLAYLAVAPDVLHDGLARALQPLVAAARQAEKAWPQTGTGAGAGAEAGAGAGTEAGAEVLDSARSRATGADPAALAAEATPAR